MTDSLIVHLPKQGSDYASVTGSLDALGALMHALPEYRDAAPSDEWRTIVIDTHRAISDALSPFTYEDDGNQTLRVEFPRAAVAVVMQAGNVAEAVR